MESNQLLPPRAVVRGLGVWEHKAGDFCFCSPWFSLPQLSVCTQLKLWWLSRAGKGPGGDKGRSLGDTLQISAVAWGQISSSHPSPHCACPAGAGMMPLLLSCSQAVPAAIPSLSELFSVCPGQAQLPGELPVCQELPARSITGGIALLCDLLVTRGSPLAWHA